MMKRLAINRAGTMGNGIAHGLRGSPQQDCSVTNVRILEGRGDARNVGASSSLERLVKQAEMTDADRQAALARITPTTDNGKLFGCDLVIEAATGARDLKIKILRDVCATLQPRALLATNTSSISIHQTRRGDRPFRTASSARTFFNPVPR